MISKKWMSILLAAVILLSSASVALADETEAPATAAYTDETVIENLTVNYQVNPIGIDESQVRFGWQMNSNLIGAAQRNYQIVVAKDSPGGDIVWDSGVVNSDLSTGISYGYAHGEELELETRYYWTVTVTDIFGNTHVSEPAFFETGAVWDEISWVMPTKSTENDAYKLAGNTYYDTDMSDLPASGNNYRNKGGNPLIRTEIGLTGENVASARLYMTGLGNYEAYINGEKVLMPDTRGEDMNPMFAPGWTDYRYFTNYQSYDVTDYISSDTIALGAQMHKGAYAGRVARAANYQNVLGSAYGSESNAKTLALLAKLVITYDDGSQQVITTDDPNSWKSIAGPIMFNDYFNGEMYDANRAQALEGWNEVGFDDSGWFVTEPAEYPGELRPNNAPVARYAEEYTLEPVSGYKFTPAENLTAEQAGIENHHGAVVPTNVDVAAPITLSYGEVLAVDLAQNMVGVLELDLEGEQNTVVKVRHSEMVNDGSDTCDAARGTLYYGAMRGADGQVSYYTLSDEGRQTWLPYATYNGFRHVEISVESPYRSVTIYGIKGKVISSVHYETGSVETSDANVNRLILNSFWGQMGNWTTIPTDCPQRTERCGWTGDIQIFSNAAMFNYDCTPFMDNMIGIYDANASNNSNNYGVVMPVAFQGGYATMLSSGWSDVGVIVPWNVYMQTGDVHIIERSFDQMDKYMDRVYAVGYNTGMFGDWLAFNGASLPYVNAVHEIYCTQLMAKMAGIIGRGDMVQKYEQNYAQLKDEFLQAPVFDEEGNRVGGGFVFDQDGTLEYIVYVGGGWGHPGTPETRYADYLAGDLMSLGNGNNNSNTKINAQTALSWALRCDLYKDEAHLQHLKDELNREVKNENGSVRPDSGENTLGVGFLGVNLILPELTDAGSPDTAYNLLMNEEVPSWLGTVVNGATTNWERWDSYTIENGFGSAGMNSFNHFSYGCVNEWMYEYMIGIKKLESAPGFKAINLQPVIDTEGRVTHANGSYESPYGKYESGWTADGGELATYSAVIPANTSATLYLPVDESAVENFVGLPTVTYLGMEEHNGINTAKFDVLPGGYDFAVVDGTLGISLQDGYADTGMTFDLVLSTEAHNVNVGDTFEINASFKKELSCNAVILNYTFNSEKFEYVPEAYNAPAGVGVVDEQYGEGYAKVTLMVPGYNAEDLGEITLKAKEGAVITRGRECVWAEAEYVLKDELGNKTVTASISSVSFVTIGDGSGQPVVLGDTNGDHVVDLLDLSNMIDWFGITSHDPNWDSDYISFDFNNNGQIDIYDIAYVARLIV